MVLMPRPKFFANPLIILEILPRSTKPSRFALTGNSSIDAMDEGEGSGTPVEILTIITLMDRQHKVQA